MQIPVYMLDVASISNTCFTNTLSTMQNMMSCLTVLESIPRPPSRTTRREGTGAADLLVCGCTN